jgi:sigma-B regulation protein RsbU (phosphoserine phosphatase)
MTALRLRIERPDGAIEERTFDRGQAIVGRSPIADVLVSDDDASRRHARLYRDAEGWWVEDLGARNRTYLNGQELTTPARLQVGDLLRIASYQLHVLQEPAGTATREDAITAVSTPAFVDPRPAPPSQVGIPPPADGSRQAARMEMLNEVHRALAMPISLDELLGLILERCFAVLRPEEGVILLRGEDGELRPAATRRLRDATGEMAISRQIIEEVAEKGRSALVLDTMLDERFSGSESLLSSGVRSVVAAPLMDADGTLGMIALYSRIGVRQFSQEDLDLLVSLASAAALRVRNIALVEQAAARKVRESVLERELALANQIQMAMLPQRRPERADVAVGAVLQPARSVGGDLYDFVLDGDHLWFVVGDVSGKGMAAALYMAVTKTLFRAFVHGDVSPDDVVARINRELSRDNDLNMFVTAVVGRLDLDSGTLLLVDAGHNPPLVLRPDGTVVQPPLRKGLVLGVLEDFPFAADTLRLDTGETLVIYTDGITEALNALGEQYQTKRFTRALVARKDHAVQEAVEGLVGDITQFAAGAPQEDDITLLVVRYLGVPRSESR